MKTSMNLLRALVILDKASLESQTGKCGEKLYPFRPSRHDKKLARQIAHDVFARNLPSLPPKTRVSVQSSAVNF